MLNMLITVVLLNVSVLSFFFTFKINRIEAVFAGLDVRLVSQSVKLDIDGQSYYFDKEVLLEKITYYFKTNLENYEYKLKFAFREDDLNTTFSSTPNIVQIDINARVIFEDVYQNNVRFSLNGREVSKDWWSIF